MAEVEQEMAEVEQEISSQISNLSKIFVPNLDSSISNLKPNVPNLYSWLQKKKNIQMQTIS